MSVSVTRRLEFDAAHRVMGHEGKCANLHGHRYVVLVTCKSDSPKTNKEGLDSIGRVIDFGVIKELIGGWIDRHWDHTTILNIDDPLVKILETDAAMPHAFPNRSPYLMKGNPTAENMAMYLLRLSRQWMLKHNIWVESIEIFETPNCSATCTDAS